MKCRPKIIFDRSAFHNDKLIKMPLLRLVNKNQIEILHTPPFLEETLQGLLNENAREVLKKQVPFILKMCNGGWLKDKDILWKEELENAGNINPFYKNSKRKSGEREYIKVVEYKAISQETRAKIEDTITKKRKPLREMRIKMWHDMEKLRKQDLNFKKFKPNFSEYLQLDITKKDFISLGKGYITENIKPENKNLENMWSKNPECYPCFTSYIKGFFYTLYSALYKSEKFDINAEKDIEQLCYLNYADIMVSNDTTSMKPVFQAIWQPEGKKFFTPDEFLDYMDKEFI